MSADGTQHAFVPEGTLPAVEDPIADADQALARKGVADLDLRSPSGDTLTITEAEATAMASDLADKISCKFDLKDLKVYAPAGSSVAAAARVCGVAKTVQQGGFLRRFSQRVAGPELVDREEDADIVILDVLDSGGKHMAHKPPVYALVSTTTVYGAQAARTHAGAKLVVFPWSTTRKNKPEKRTPPVEARRRRVSNAVSVILKSIGDNPDREGLVETPLRVAKAMEAWFDGYGRDAEAVLKTFEDGAQGVDQMITQTGIPFFSQCEHHMAPFFGSVHVAYIPGKRILGLSKVSRLVDIFAHRLQVQERLTEQIAGALMTGLKARGVAVIVEARHLCMESRGIRQQGVTTTTSALHGFFKDDPATRAEFHHLVAMSRRQGSVL